MQLDANLRKNAMHLVLTSITILLILLIIGFGATSSGKWFRIYSILTISILLLFGIWAGLDAPRIAVAMPTPWLGIKERINIYGYIIWMMVLAFDFLRAEKLPGPSKHLPAYNIAKHASEIKTTSD
ncbi:hypothetical protein G8759_14485 [Spirosoma aureum]|uniref:Uncharacterized protein n=1 Tax=Spirosoma aureum TaxID=2692134 RepID=A0A6G9AN17_9BACT|nr:hypothetical protein [Spirosoma aureum]QIP13736.1 hypothetical protein G8759_14485 [Spirosoma aureum]